MPEESSKVVVGKQGRLRWIDPSPESGDHAPITVLMTLDTGEEALSAFDQLELLPNDNYNRSRRPT